MSRDQTETTVQPTLTQMYALEDDVQVMQAAQSDPRLFAVIYERYFSRIYGYCLRQIGNPNEAEDLSSYVFVYAFRSLPNYRGGSVASWLFRIAYGTVMNHLRKVHRHEITYGDSTPEVAADIPEPLDHIVQAEAHATVRELVASLTPEEQHLLSLKMDAGLSSQEIGELLGKSPGAVRTQLHRIIKRLRDRYNSIEK